MKTWMILAALALLLAACGGGDPEPERDSLPVDCKADPKLCV